MHMSRVSVVLVLAVLGCNEPPGPPVVSISPVEPGTLDDLTAQIASESVDPNEDPVSYTWTWLQDGAVRGDLTAESVPASETTKGETWTAIALPSDGELQGETAQASVLIVNTPPQGEVSIPVDIPRADEPVVAMGSGSDVDGDAVELSWAWTCDGAPTEYAGTTVPAEATTRGEIWEVTLVASDGEEEGEPVRASASIANVPPAITSLSLAPSEVYEATVVEAVVESTDADGDEVTLSYAWYVAGVLVQEGEQGTLTGEWFSKHDEVHVVVTPSDGFVDGEAVSSETSTVANTAPILTSATVSPAEIYEASELSCLPAGWADDDGDAEDHRVRWLVDGAEVSTESTLTGASFGKGETVVCELTPFDGEEAGAPVLSDGVTVLNTAPVLASASLSDTSPVEGDTLSVTLGTATDADGDSLSYSYAWYVEASQVATTSTLSSSDFDKGEEIYVVVTPNDGTDAGASVTSDTATAVNTPPVMATVTLSPEEAYTDDVLEALATATDADGDSLSFSYAWTVDGASVSETGSNLDGDTWFDKDQEVIVYVTPSDDEEAGTTVASDPVTILNTPPTAPEVSIDPEEPTPEDDLVCQVDVDSEDADGDAVSYTVEWDVDGTAFTGADTTTETGDTVLADDTLGGELWTCTVTPNDGDEDGDVASVEADVCGEDVDVLYAGSQSIAKAPASSDWYLSEMSVEFWTRFDSLSTDYNHMSVAANNGATRGWHCTVEATRPHQTQPRFFMDVDYRYRGSDTSVGAARLEYTPTLSADQWYHFACQYDGSTMRLFIDGTEVASKSYAGSVDYNGTDELYLLFRNQWYASGTQDYYTRMVRIGDTVLYTSDFTPEWDLESTTGTVALYPMDEGSGSTLYDAVGGHDASLGGSTSWTTTDEWCP